jgi:release factor glutamine methyltransferase
MTYTELWRTLTAVYNEREAQAVARLLLEEHFGLTMADVLTGRMPDEGELAPIRQRLLTGEPVQYVLGWAAFGGRRFAVRPGVLIPRPETYELCQWAVDAELGARAILDVGTGSGCIACTLAAELAGAAVTAWDVSVRALGVARENAERTNVNVSFEQVDVLSNPPASRSWDVIVSNPPYVCEREQAAMERHVLDYEPHLALFVPDDDPLLFYRSIARYAIKALKPDGALCLEINPLYARQLDDMLQKTGFRQVTIHQDDYDKDRYIIAWK